jgi:hypothetical protein
MRAVYAHRAVRHPHPPNGVKLSCKGESPRRQQTNKGEPGLKDTELALVCFSDH